MLFLLKEAFDKLLKVFADKKEFIEKQAREQVRYIAVFLWKVFLPGDWKGGGASCTFLTAVMLITLKQDV